MKLTSSAVLLVLLVAAGCGGEDNSFTRDYNQHLANIELAQRNGVLDSAR